MSEEPKKELTPVEIIARGIRAKNFVSSYFWEKDLSPEIVREQLAADIKRSYDPRLKDMSPEPREFRAYYSGVFAALEMLSLSLNRMIREGEEAENAQREKDEKKKAKESLTTGVV